MPILTDEQVEACQLANEVEALVTRIAAKTGMTRREIVLRLMTSIEQQEPPRPAAPASSIPPGYEPMVERAVAQRMKEIA